MVRIKNVCMMEDIAIYGAGGFGKTVACLINSINVVKKKWNLIGYFDDGYPIGYNAHYAKVIGGINELNAYQRKINVVFAIGKPHIIQTLVNKVENINVEYPNLLAPNALILDEDTLVMGKGNIVMFNCLISNHVTIGDFNTFNCGVYLGHDDVIGSFNSLMPSVRISGEVKIGNLNFFGVSSVVLQQKTIGNNTTIGANSVVMRKTLDNHLYLGNPAKRIS